MCNNNARNTRPHPRTPAKPPPAPTVASPGQNPATLVRKNSGQKLKNSKSTAVLYNYLVEWGFPLAKILKTPPDLRALGLATLVVSPSTLHP